MPLPTGKRKATPQIYKTLKIALLVLEQSKMLERTKAQ